MANPLSNAISFTADLILNIFGLMLKLSYALFGWRFVTLLGNMLGKLAFAIKGRKRSIVITEIAYLLGKDAASSKVRDITKRSFIVDYTRMVENFFFGELTAEGIRKIVKVEGLANFEEGLAKGRGVIILLAHFGSFLMPLPYLGYAGFTVNQVAGRQVFHSLIGSRIWWWRKRQADRLPVKFIQVEKFLRPIYEALKAGEAVTIAFDGREGTQWIDAPFLSRTARFSPGPFLLARRTGATIIPTFVVSGKGNSKTLHLGEPFRLSPTQDESAALAEDTRRFAAIFADYVRRYPCHFGAVLYKIKMEHEMRNTASFYAEEP